ncbi:hypothetical protein N7539_003419 [Penicillium diatomitis]|uniref:Zn(2)-C6 fungal-type domain-containing protein n=1 Tax=Penicillium diatomitis TaxID=2819901 RepID=A0A9W9XBV2_9EURO|nr:uncharacterized protein N7539_003419 [Penicillium diatomitis]KAJ5488529.1 hypothetical protein N7539_003419 [Penicillium diatomitis]
MGRPKVLPANRLRANTACTTCRASKKRCSGSFPCTNCIHKGRAQTCIPFKSASSFRSPTLTRARREPAASRQPVGTSPASPCRESRFNNMQTRPSRLREGSPSDQQLERSFENGSRSPEATHRTHPRMLRNLQGERVYVGKAASLSFLQLLRETVTQHIGPSQFSHNYRSEDMLETEAQHDLLDFSENSCSLEARRTFIQKFSIATSGLIYLGQDTTKLLTEPQILNSSQGLIHAAVGDLMIAIGAQSCPNDADNVRAMRFFAERGQRRAFTNMLEDPSLDLVRVFLLLSYYMFGACRRNAAFMYLGVATRAAVALGLHVDSSGTSSPASQTSRSQIWMSLCTVDLLTSSILGRPAATAGLLSWSRVDLVLGSSPVASGLLASYQVALVVDEITTRLYSKRAASTETADSLLAKLNSWSSLLPESLRTPLLKDDDPDACQERIIGNMHVACFYHFAVILVTRPFLITTLSVRLARLHQTLTAATSPEPLEEDPAHSRLAAACIDSAVYMLQTCREVHQSEMLLKQMTILKALIFAAALVLGFSMFSHRSVDTEVDNAFSGALQILQMLSHQSAQAAHYLDILTLLESAIKQQRQRLSAQARHRRSQYVNRIFSLSETPSLARDQDQGTETCQGSSITSVQTQGGFSFPWTSDDIEGVPFTPPIVDGGFLDWEGMELPLWDSFPFTEPGSSILPGAVME